MSWCIVSLNLFGISFLLTSAVSGSYDTSAYGCSGNGCKYFRDDYTYEETTNAFYKLNRVRVPWYDAVTWCQEEGAELALPTTFQEAQILLNYFTHATSNVWLPFHDQYSEGIFISKNGTSLTKLYSNWLYGEPDNGGPAGEDCVVLSKEGYYSDVACTDNNMFICKKNNVDFLKNPECLTNIPGYKLSALTGSCYKIHPEPRNWYSAFRICEAEMAGLVELNSQAEAAYLVEELKAYPDSILVGTYSFKFVVHIDANELLSENNYVTRSGKTLQEAGYNVWFLGQPDKGGEHCGCMGKLHGSLYDLNCQTHLAMFVCEKESVISKGRQLIQLRGFSGL